MKLQKNKITQVITYLLVGGGTALLELVLFSVLYRWLQVDVAAANIIAVIVATITNFLLNGTVTFKGSSNLVRSIVLYTVLFLFNTCFSTTVIALLVQAGFPAELVKLGTMVCIVIWNYILYRNVVFK